LTVSSLLWQLQPPHGQPRWLFGTMHIRDNRVYWFGEKLYPLIQQADIYVGEMELNIPEEITLPATYDIKEYLSISVYQKARKQILKSFNIDLDRFTNFHPLMVVSAISQSVLAAEHQVSLDEHLWHFAATQGKPTIGLESYMEQNTLLHNLDVIPLYKQLVKISRSPSSIGRQTQKALSWYMKGDIHQLYRITKSSMHGLRKEIIYKRNHIMANRICDFDMDKKYFIAVGAGHLSGKYGLLALLKRSGWKISAIHLPAEDQNINPAPRANE
jgi:uncharacterized protein YbaP (TraB family)